MAPVLSEGRPGRVADAVDVGQVVGKGDEGGVPGRPLVVAPGDDDRLTKNNTKLYFGVKLSLKK